MTALAAPTSAPEAYIPHDLDAEQCTLGSMLFSRAALAKAFAIITVADFYYENHRLICAAIETCYQRQDPADISTVATELRTAGKLDQCGGREYLQALLAMPPTEAHVNRYASTVREKSILRQIITLGADLGNDASQATGSAGELLAEAQEKLSALYRERVQQSVLRSPVDTFAEDTARLWEEVQAEAPPVSSAQFGIGKVDRDLGGLEAQRLVIVKGDTKHGKSQLLRQSALATARRFRDDGSERVVALFILEEGYWPWRKKCLAWLSGIDSFKLLIPGRGKWLLRDDPDAEKKLTQAESEWVGLPLRYAFRMNDLTQIIATCRALTLQERIGMVCIDYFQLMTGADAGARTQEQALSARAQRLQLLADELECPVMVPSQITFDRDTKRLNTKDARAIEHNASIVIEWRREEAEGVLLDKGYLGCLVSRNTAGFRPMPVVTDMRCGRFWDPEDYAQEQSRARQEAAEGGPFHDN